LVAFPGLKLSFRSRNQTTDKLKQTVLCCAKRRHNRCREQTQRRGRYLPVAFPGWKTSFRNQSQTMDMLKRMERCCVQRQQPTSPVQTRCHAPCWSVECRDRKIWCQIRPTTDRQRRMVLWKPGRQRIQPCATLRSSAPG